MSIRVPVVVVAYMPSLPNKRIDGGTPSLGLSHPLINVASTVRLSFLIQKQTEAKAPVVILI